MRRSTIFIPLALCVLLVVSGCRLLSSFGGHEVHPPSNPKVTYCEPGRWGGNLKLALTGAPLTFNPFVASSPETYEITSKLFGTLLDYDYANQKFPEASDGLARSIDALPDGKTFIIHLREGVAFSNGAPITSDDVIYSYQVALDEKSESIYSEMMKGPEGETPKFTKEDTYTLRATFPKRIEPIKLIFAKVPIVSKISFSERAVKVGLNDTYSLDTSPDNIVSSGPFVLKSYIPDKQIELSYNKYYWKVDSSGTSLPYLDQVTYALKTPTENQLTSFTRSELHLMKVLPKDIQKLNEGGQFKVADLGTSVNTWQLVLNWRADQKKIDPTKATWFRIPGFRNGLMYAVDRNRIVKEVFDSKAKVAYNQVSPANTTWYNSDINRPEYNLETAKASITKVGFQFDGSGNLKYMGGRVTRFTITHINDYIPTQIANRLVEDLKKVGVEAEADPKDYKTFWKIANLGTFDTLLVQATPMFSDPAFLHPYLTKRGKYFWFYETGQGSTRLVGAGEGWMDKISTRMGEAITKVLLSERRELYNQIQADWNLSAPVVYIASDNVITASQKVIGNFKPATLEPSLTWNIEEFYIK